MIFQTRNSHSFHSAPECPTLTVEGSTQTNWTALSGRTTTIECEIIGSKTLTCLEDGSWSSDAPKCHGNSAAFYLFQVKYLISFLSCNNSSFNSLYNRSFFLAIRQTSKGLGLWTSTGQPGSLVLCIKEMRLRASLRLRLKVRIHDITKISSNTVKQS